MTGAGTVAAVPVTLGGTLTRLAEAGPTQANEAVVFLHGNPGSVEDWVGLLPEAGNLRRAVAFDLPDFGRAVAPEGFAHSLSAYADFLETALGQLGIERVHLVAHDFGGPIGLEWAARNPQRLVGVTLIDTGVLPGYRWHRIARLWQAPVLGEAAQAVLTRKIFRRVVKRPEPRSLPNWFVDGMYDNLDHRTRRAILRLYRGAADLSSWSERMIAALAPADIPAVVIWGAADSYLPVKLAEHQRLAFPSADLHLLSGSGHWPHIDDPATVTGLLLGQLGG